MMNLSKRAEQYRLWFEYEKDANLKVVRSLESVPADRRGTAEYKRALSLLGHLAAARRVWLFRFGKLSTVPTAIFPESALEEIVADWRDVEARWDEYYLKLEDGELDRVFEYRSMDAGRFRNRIEDILTQLFGHSWYHRGQIAMLVRAAGGEPAITDFVYWCREPV